MRFTCEKNSLVQGLNIVSRTVAQKSSLSVIEGILCKAGLGICLTGYNMETAISYEIEAEVTDSGECILPARLFGDIIRRLPEGPVTVVVDETYKMSIRSGFASFTITYDKSCPRLRLFEKFFPPQKRPAIRQGANFSDLYFSCLPL